MGYIGLGADFFTKHTIQFKNYLALWSSYSMYLVLNLRKNTIGLFHVFARL